MHYQRKNIMPLKIINSSLIDLPAMSNLSHMWNFGSLLGITLTIQLVTGIFLAMNYTSNIEISFLSINHIMHNVNNGWMMRFIHSNGASSFFLFIYMHMGRNIYFNSFNLKTTWTSGIIILFISMATAFLGYVLPWGQMSFWGATVITNLLSAIPLYGKQLVIWIWGGFSVNNSTLTRFFSLHFFLPFILSALVITHLMYLHENKSSNPMGINNSIDKIPFAPYFNLKDLMSILLLGMFFGMINLTQPYLLMDSENFSMANPLVTPNHIQPEWYFLFAYAILRGIPNKLGGVMALFLSIFMFFFLAIKNNKLQYSEKKLKYLSFWSFFLCFFFLTWMGMKPVEQPFIYLSQILSFNYFLIILFWMM